MTILEAHHLELARRAPREALAKLGVQRFVLGLQQSAFPRGKYDIGAGAPCSEGGERVLSLCARLGFDGLQLGPSGRVSAVNLSPYDGTVFSRSRWSIDLAALATPELGALLTEAEACALATEGPHERVEPDRAERVSAAAVGLAATRLAALRRGDPGHPLVRRFADFTAAASPWLSLDALYEATVLPAGDDPGRLDPGLRAVFEPGEAGESRRRALRATLAPRILEAEVGQFLAHEQHRLFRARARQHGVRLFGDLQVGVSQRERFLYASAFQRRFLLGAPPSRTNPEGQPWGYPLLDPDQTRSPGSAARTFFARRIAKMFEEHDGVRIDHPHGLVCPWVYEAARPDPAVAVREGTRAFSSPDLGDADLSRWAIAGEADLDRCGAARHADGWVTQLTDDQVARYATLVDVMFDLAREAGHGHDSIFAEILSTCPYPLRRVLERHGLGRFRVVQKADPGDVRDPYRTEAASAEDWVMLGTHDTPAIRAVVQGWFASGAAAPRAEYLAGRLARSPARRAELRRSLLASESALLTGLLADLFVGPARNVYVFASDLLGEVEPYNRAGVVHPDNWTYRLPADPAAALALRVQEGRALDVPRALALALEARGL